MPFDNTGPNGEVPWSISDVAPCKEIVDLTGDNDIIANLQELIKRQQEILGIHVE